MLMPLLFALHLSVHFGHYILIELVENKFVASLVVYTKLSRSKIVFEPLVNSGSHVHIKICLSVPYIHSLSLIYWDIIGEGINVHVFLNKIIRFFNISRDKGKFLGLNQLDYTLNVIEKSNINASHA
ncbi:hypothetical protein ACJX0J_019557, partial [Zea mays]